MSFLLNELSMEMFVKGRTEHLAAGERLACLLGPSRPGFAFSMKKEAVVWVRGQVRYLR
jgi:hypothetical protein